MGTPYEDLKEMADIIREKTNTTEKLSLDQMVLEIDGMCTESEQILQKIIDNTIRHVYISYGISSIGSHTFYGCSSLTSINIPESVTKIGMHTFYGCSSLTSINIPESVTKIGTFYGCSSLTSITLLKNDSIVALSGSTSFTNTKIASGEGYIYVPSNLVEEYKTATNWSAYADQIVAIE